MGKKAQTEWDRGSRGQQSTGSGLLEVVILWFRTATTWKTHVMVGIMIHNEQRHLVEIIYLEDRKRQKTVHM